MAVKDYSLAYAQTQNFIGSANIVEALRAAADFFEGQLKVNSDDSVLTIVSIGVTHDPDTYEPDLAVTYELLA